MRLLDTRTGEFKWVEDPRQVRYAILSHVWARPGDPAYPEQTYQDLLQVQKEARADGTLPISKFSDKLRRFCETALQDGSELGWADTCCIDKTSSSELSEAINSMYRWYAYSAACYAFLHDVKPPSEDSEWRATFKESKWFKRGWTLQELIASRVVIFVCEASGREGGWEGLGSKHSLAASISSVTSIDIAVLNFKTSLAEIPIARRMAWTQSRQTSRLEDEAYCLMGIFGVSMQTNYGEGRYAFIRLQKKILSQSPDQTIFAWGRFLEEPFLTLLPSSSSTTPAVGTPPDLSHNPIAPPSFPKQYLLASSPKDFYRGLSANIFPLSREVFQQRLGLPITEDLYQVFEITPYGLRTQFPLLNVCSPDPHPNATTHCAILACENPEKGLLALLLRPRKHLRDNEFFAGAIVRSSQQQSGTHDPFSSDRDDYSRLMYITPERLKSLRKSTASIFTLYRHRVPLTVSRVYIPHYPSLELDFGSSIHAMLRQMSERFEVKFCRWSKRLLELQGYRVSRGSNGAQDELDKPFADSESILNRTSSFNEVENAIIISNNLSGVYLTVQVGRCSCDLGRRSGILGILVSSPADADSLEGEFFSQDHPIHHRIHVRSWSLDHGTASRQFEFDSPNGLRRLGLRLVLTSIASSSTNSPDVRRYRLSAELREPELQNPRQPLPLNPTSSRSARKRSNSLPSKVPEASPESSERESSPAWELRKPPPGSAGRYHLDNGHIDTVGLIALGAFLAFALLLLSPNVER